MTRFLKNFNYTYCGKKKHNDHEISEGISIVFIWEKSLSSQFFEISNTSDEEDSFFWSKSSTIDHALRDVAFRSGYVSWREWGRISYHYFAILRMSDASKTIFYRIWSIITSYKYIESEHGNLELKFFDLEKVTIIIHRSNDMS